MAWEARGEVSYAREVAEESNVVFRRSIYAVRDIGEGEILTPENVRVIRPGFGLPPQLLTQVLGRSVRRAVRRGEPILWKTLG